MNTIKEDYVHLIAESFKLTGDTCYVVQAFTDAGKTFKVQNIQEAYIKCT